MPWEITVSRNDKSTTLTVDSWDRAIPIVDQVLKRMLHPVLYVYETKRVQDLKPETTGMTVAGADWQVIARKAA